MNRFYTAIQDSNPVPLGLSLCEQVKRQVFVHSTRLLCMYTAPRGLHAPPIVRPRTTWRTRRQLLANPFLRPMVIMGYWVPILCVERSLAQGHTAPNQLSSLNSWAWHYTSVPSGDYKWPPVVQVLKANGEVRVCGDYKLLIYRVTNTGCPM